jgi:hypothetical protein
MKKIILLSGIILMILSCEKDATYCRDCIVTQVSAVSGATSTKYTTSTSALTRCDMSSGKISRFEKATTSGNITTSASCTQQ